MWVLPAENAALTPVTKKVAARIACHDAGY
jgi:hypothetical protein